MASISIAISRRHVPGLTGPSDVRPIEGGAPLIYNFVTFRFIVVNGHAHYYMRVSQYAYEMPICETPWGSATDREKLGDGSWRSEIAGLRSITCLSCLANPFISYCAVKR